MWRVLVVVGSVLLTSILLYVHARATTAAPTVILGMPVTGSSSHQVAWISLGGTGAVVIGGGVGLVEIGVYGVGLLFATGQVCAGGVAIGQAAFGLCFVLAQLGLGLLGVVQGGAGGYMKAQGALAADGDRIVGALDAWLGRVLRLSLR